MTETTIPLTIHAQSTQRDALLVFGIIVNMRLKPTVGLFLFFEKRNVFVSEIPILFSIVIFHVWWLSMIHRWI
jgi:hypothetical protein